MSKVRNRQVIRRIADKTRKGARNRNVIAVGDAVNAELLKLHTEVSYYEDLDAKMSFCYPDAGRMPEKEDEIVASDLVLKALGVPCEIGQKVPLVLQIGDKTYKKTFTLCGYFEGDMIAQAQVMAVSKAYAGKVAPTPVESAMDHEISTDDYPGRIVADFNFATSLNLEKQVEELSKRCGFPETVDTGINWAYMGKEIDMQTALLIVSLLLVILVSGYLIIYNIFYINVYHDIRHYGLLKTIGTTGKQLRKIVHRQANMLCLYGIPLVLLNTIYSLMSGFDMDKFVAVMTVSDFSVTDATLDNLSVNLDSIVKDGVTKKFQEALEEQAGIEETGNIYMKEVDPVFTDEMYVNIEKRIFDNPDTQEALSWYAGEEGQEYMDNIRKERLIDGKVYGISRLIMDKMENVEGKLNWEEFSSGKYVIATRFDADESSADYFKPGEKVIVTNAEGKTREYEVLAVANLPHACEFQQYGIFECNFILPEQEYLDFVGEQQPMRTLFNVEKDQEDKVEEWLSDYCENVNPALTYTSKASIVAEFDSFVNVYSTVGGLLAFILAMIGILNFINTMVTSVLSRKQEFAMMQAVGMTGRQLNQMLCFEGIYYAVFTGVLALMLGTVLNATAVRSIGNGFFFFTWRFTVAPILLCIPFLLAVVLVVPYVCCRKMAKTSVVERMKSFE